MKTKRLVAASVLSIGISFTGVSAGIPVIDVGSIAEAVKSYTELRRHFDVLTRQMEQAERDFESMTGSRGLSNLIDTMYDGNVLDGIDVERVLRDNGIQPSQDLGLTGESARLHDLSNSNAAIYAEASAKSLQQSEQRFSELTRLIEELNNADDPKYVMDLTARIGAEQVLLQNETVKLQALQQQAEANQMLQAQQERQMWLELLH